MATARERGLSPLQAAVKRAMDLVGALLGLALSWWLIAIAYVVAAIDTRANGFFLQARVGRNGKVFRVIKIRTMRARSGVDTTVTTDRDTRVTRIGHCQPRRMSSTTRGRSRVEGSSVRGGRSLPNTVAASRTR